MSNFWLDKKNENKVTIESLQAENATLKAKINNLENEYNLKLEEAYEELSGELIQAEKIAEQGYQEAYEIICDLRSRLDAEGKSSVLEGFPPSNTISPSVKITDKDLGYSPDVELEVRLFNEYEEKVKEVKKYIVNKVDEFLNLKSQEMTPKEIRNAYTAQQIVDEATQ